MPYIRKTKDRLESIPPQLCLVQEAMQILGLKNRPALKNYFKKGLRYSFVIYKGYRRFIFNRKEVESFRHPSPPPNTISTKDLCILINKTCKTKLLHSQIIYHLKRHCSIHPQRIPAQHAYYAWPKDSAIPAATQLAKDLLHKKLIQEKYNFQWPKPQTQPQPSTTNIKHQTSNIQH